MSDVKIALAIIVFALFGGVGLGKCASNHLLQDLEQLQPEDEMVDRMLHDGILDGHIKAQTVADRTLATVGLVLMKGGIKTKVADGNVTFGTNVSGNPRVDMVQWDGKALSVKAGTPGASPACPAPDAGNIPIALAWLPTAYAGIYTIGHPTTEGVVFAYYSARQGLFACRSGDAHTNFPAGGGTADISGTLLPVYILRPGNGYEVKLKAQGVSADADPVQLELLIALDGNTGMEGSWHTIMAGNVTEQRLTMYEHRVGWDGYAFAAGAHKIQGQIQNEGGDATPSGYVHYVLTSIILKELN